MVYQGAYTLWQSGEGTELLLIATGSEVELALNAAAKLAEESVNVRVVSMPSFELFEQQDAVYQRVSCPMHVIDGLQSRRERALVGSGMWGVRVR